MRCPCCFCNDRNASGSGVDDGLPMIPGRNECTVPLSKNINYDLIYFPRHIQELKLNEKIVSPIVELAVGKGKRVTIDVRKIISVPNDYVWSSPQLLIDFFMRRNVSTENIKDIFKTLKGNVDINKQLKLYIERKTKIFKKKEIDLYPIYKYLLILIFIIIIIKLF